MSSLCSRCFPVGVPLGLDPGHAHQRGHAQRRALGQAFQPVMDQHAILIDQRHHVGHRPQGRQSDGLEEEIAHPRADLLRAAGLLAQRPGQLEGHARAAQTAEGIGAAGQPRMDDRRGLGQTGAGLVMIGDDQVQAEPPRQGGLLDAGDAAIDRQQQVRLAVAPGADGVGVQPVAFLDAVRHVVGHFGAEHLQAQPEDGRAGHAVNVVIAVDDDPLAGGHGVVDPPHGLGAAGQELRIAQRGKLGVEEGSARAAGSVMPRQISNWATTAGIPAARLQARRCGQDRGDEYASAWP